MSLPRMSWHIGDYKKDTGHLRAAEHGAYFLLCMHYWATGGLPDNDRQLATIACMTDREWKAARPIIEPLFKGEGKWKHKRIEEELVLAQAKYEKLAAAGSKGGQAKATNKRRSSEACSDATAWHVANGYQPITDNQEERAEANASGADAPSEPIDHRTKLFNESLQTLARMTGKTPDSCRSLVGRWLKAVEDEAIHVIAAIEDADRNRIADPVAWITRTLTPKARQNGQTPPNRFAQALEQLGRSVEADRSESGSAPPPRLLSHG